MIAALNLGGAERQLLSTAKALLDRGHRVTVVTIKQPGELARSCEDQGIALTSLGGGLSSIWRLRRHLREEATEAAYAFLPSASIACSIATLGLKTVRVVWGVRASDIDFGLYRFKERTVWKLSIFLSRFPDLIIANSARGAQFHISVGYPSERMVVVPNGVSSERFFRSSSLRELERQKRGFTRDDFVVGMLARFDPIKGHDFLVETVSRWGQYDSKIKFLLVGGGDSVLRSAVRTQLEALVGPGRCCVLDQVENPIASLNAIDVLAVTSRSEGFPNSALEAMACGVPVVGFNVGDLCDIVEPPGRVVEIGDLEALWAGLLGVRNERRFDVAKAQVQAVERRYSVDRLGERTENALLDLFSQDPEMDQQSKK